jgi:long-chain-fatty-acid--[acyl-carrier-protein] ligase
MKTIVQYFLAYFLSMVLWFRYKIKIKGLDKLNAANLNKPGGILFLPNHPTVFVDSTAITIALWPKFPIRPMVVDTFSKLPIVKQVIKLLNGLSVPDFTFSSNSLKKKMNDKVEQEVINGLKNKDNFLIFPSGRTKQTGYEAIDGASAVHRIVQESPECNIVLIRVKGLWGSSFSRVVLGRTPPFFETVWNGFKHVLKNFIFFCPRREVIIEFEPAPANFPYVSNRLEFNKFLERWYNKPDGLRPQEGAYPGDSLILVSYSLWKEEFPKLWSPADEDNIDVSTIPIDIQKKVISKISEITKAPEASITTTQSLTSDLGMDSLDISEMVAFLQDQYDIIGVAATDLTTVGKLMALASKQIAGQHNLEDAKYNTSTWNKPIERKKAVLAEGSTIPEVFLNNCNKMGNAPACADMRTGIMTYSQLKLRALILADYIKKLPGEYIGILLPASSAASMTILACQLAGKIPLMVNWTVGPRHLQAVVQLSKVQKVITSWSFIDRLPNIEFGDIDEMMIMLEDMRQEISWADKVKAFLLAKRNTKTILKTLGIDNQTKDHKAVLLFTSGTESLPKGVPLTHENILSNERAAFEAISPYSDDILYAILPPFHSFGFTGSLIALLSGMRVAFSPDPTDGRRLAQGFEKWGATIVIGAPSFIKGLLKASTPEQLKTLRLCIVGAEKLPPDLEIALNELGKKECLLEGYGVTECAPALTFTRPNKPRKGVGQPLPGVKLCVVDLHDNHKTLATGQQGLILANGPNVFTGYLNPGISSPFITLNNDSKWYVTGDLGFLDVEGHLILSGRLKRFIKIGGEMVSLASIEEELMQTSLKNGWTTANEEGPSIAIIAREDAGEKTRIYLFCKFSISLDEVNKALKDAGFSNITKISGVITLPELPLTGTGKINYRKLEEMEKESNKINN